MKIMAEEVQGKTRRDKMDWALQLKDHANSLYHNQKFREAAKVYTDCLVALDFGETEEDSRETQVMLQLPVTTNLAACMIEQGVRCRGPTQDASNFATLQLALTLVVYVLCTDGVWRTTDDTNTRRRGQTSSQLNSQ
mmetsp:Transcript_96605/g.258285  ORF Transcript_96605/g.258285 Transcript_96605/m.258285 type:complete len:137 (-) Transcript_96605:489-899(-)